MKQHTQPATYRPDCPSDFIGGARDVAKLLDAKARTLAKNPNIACRYLLIGPPGVGKTELANMFARRLAGHPTQIESVNGRNVDINLVRKWQESSHYRLSLIHI
ncbi:MAG: AAA family ATPase [Verrucomicrobiae bacterium]|nr:AAA family ATPase [Verrucomicrobiae bacterium]